jgi:hypothetical protein
MAARITINGVERDETPEEEAERLGLSHIPEPSPFKPIEPVPFWTAAWDLLQLKKSDILDAITDPDERYYVELAIEGRKTYLRDDPMVIQLATLKGYDADGLDQLWLFVQENYK